MPALPAVFLDKDGTLVDDVPYNVDPARLRFRPGALPSVAALAAAGYALLIVTNQSGIALGYFSQGEFARLCGALAERLAAEAGVDIKGVLSCPHAPDGQGRPLCGCRKPRPGMLREAERRYGIDLRRSWMVGDTLDDVEAGRRAGCRSILYDSGGETLWRLTPSRRPYARVSDWAAVTRLILAQARQDGMGPVGQPSMEAS